MRKLFIFIAAALLTATVWAQSPDKMSYQAVIRNSSDVLVTNTQIGMQISILQGSTSGTAVYVETQSPTTNVNGLVSIEIGTGNMESGDFSTIDWSDGPYFIKTETAIYEPFTTYTITGISQLLSVPYALHAKSAESLSGALPETDPIFGQSVASNIISDDILAWNNKLDVETDPQVGENSEGFVSVWDGTSLVSGSIFEDESNRIGLGTTSPAFHLDVNGDMRLFNMNDSPALFFTKNNSDVPGVSYYSAAIMAPIGSTSRDLAFYTQHQGTYSEKVRILGNGKVGIGTASPATELSVNGVITANGGNSDDWNNKQDELIAGTGIEISNNVISATNTSVTYSVGDFAQGGVVFWVDETGQHGLVCAKEDQSSGIRWYAGTYGNTQAKADGPNAGASNTCIIIAAQVAIGDDGSPYAARICNELQLSESGNVYCDWYLPSKEELNLVCQNRTIIDATAMANGGAGFTSNYYWSSTENDDLSAWMQNFLTSEQFNGTKYKTTYSVRAIRRF